MSNSIIEEAESKPVCEARSNPFSAFAYVVNASYTQPLHDTSCESGRESPLRQTGVSRKQVRAIEVHMARNPTVSEKTWVVSQHLPYISHVFQPRLTMETCVSRFRVRLRFSNLAKRKRYDTHLASQVSSDRSLRRHN